MTLTVDGDGRLETEFNYDEEADWGDVPPSASAYVADQQRFPRDDAHQPQWLKQRPIEGGGVGPVGRGGARREWTGSPGSAWSGSEGGVAGR